jgi:hypothetical protein
MAMDLFKTDASIEETKDTLGGGSFVWDTGVYDVVIDSVYMDQSRGGAYNLNFVFKTADGRTLNQTLYVTSGAEKGTRNYFEKDGKKKYLPGFVTANEIALVTTGKELSQLEMEDKIVEIYDYDLQKKVPTTKPVFMDLIGKQLKLGVHKVKEYKKTKDASGAYVPTSEIKEFNEVNKTFNTEGLTAVELKAGETESKFLNKWLERHGADFVRDKTKGVTPVGGGTSGMPSASTGATPSLFNK